MANRLFVTKSHETLMEELRDHSRLKRVLGPVQLTSLGVGAIIGTGIFVLVGVAAHDCTGPALMLSFVAAGLTCVFAYARRIIRLDHRLGFDSGICRRVVHRGSRLVPLFSGLHHVFPFARAAALHQRAI